MRLEVSSLFPRGRHVGSDCEEGGNQAEGEGSKVGRGGD